MSLDFGSKRASFEPFVNEECIYADPSSSNVLKDLVLDYGAQPRYRCESMASGTISLIQMNFFRSLLDFIEQSKRAIHRNFQKICQPHSLSNSSQSEYKFVCLKNHASSSNVGLWKSHRISGFSIVNFEGIRSTAGALAPAIEILRKSWHISKEEEEAVSVFLQKNSKVLLLLDEIYPELRKIFVKEKFALEILDCPEELSSPKLLVLVISREESGVALRLLETFDREWFLDNYSRCDGLLSVDVRFE
jgi:hypothetical protein